jgi:hypothetical protein
MKLGIMRSWWLAAALALAALSTACIHRPYRVYDPYYNDYHKWNDSEIEHYNLWCQQTHRDANRDFRTLPPEEQEEYWKWRHTYDDRHHH